MARRLVVRPTVQLIHPSVEVVRNSARPVLNECCRTIDFGRTVEGTHQILLDLRNARNVSARIVIDSAQLAGLFALHIE